MIRVVLTSFLISLLGAFAILWAPNTAYAVSCTVSVSEYQTGSTAIYPDTRFIVRLSLDSTDASKKYTIKAVNSSGGEVIPFQDSKSIYVPSGPLIAFGPFNPQTTLGTYTVFGYEDTSTSSQPIVSQCGSTSFAVVAKPSGSSSQAGCTAGQVNTAVGCVPTDPGGLAQVVLTLALGIAGGLAILFIIIGGFKVATSAGNPDQLEDGRATITSALAGLVFILLAVSILVIIGVDILGIPALSRSGNGIGLPSLR